MTIKTPCAHDGCGKNVDPRTKSGLCIAHKVEALRMSRIHLERPCEGGCGSILTHRHKRNTCGACISKQAKARIVNCDTCGRQMSRGPKKGRECLSCIRGRCAQERAQKVSIQEPIKPAPPFSVGTVLEAAAAVAGVSVDELASARRWGKWVRIRSAIYLVCRPYYSLPHIGRVVGGRDHTTVMHGISIAEREIAQDWRFQALTESIRNEATRATLRKRRLIAATVERLAA